MAFVDASRDPRLMQLARRTQSRYQSVSDMLERDGSETVEYIKGQGQVKITKRVEEVRREEPLDLPASRTFAVTNAISTTGSPALSGAFDWSCHSDQFRLRIGEQCLEIAGAALKWVIYSVDPPTFLLAFLRATERHCFFRLFNTTCYVLRSILEQRIGATSVHLRNADDVVREIEKIRQATSKLHKIEASLFSTVQHELREKVPVPEPKQAESHVAESCTTVQRGKVERKPIMPAQTRPTQGIIAPTLSPPRKLAVGQYVLRMRDLTKRGSQQKFDEDDVFDGPFEVISVPTMAKPKIKGQVNERSSDIPQEIDMNSASDSALIKLGFPVDPARRSGQVNPWVPLWRVRCAYFVSSAIVATRISNSELYAGAKHDRPFVPAKRGNEADEIWVVSKIAENKYARMLYVDPRGLGDSVYEVEKLRGKLIDRVSIRDLPEGLSEESDSDPAITKFFAQGGRLPASQVLMVKYLVHWSSWPSEDDTWEIARGNLPKKLVEEFEEENEGLEVEVPPNSPPRKRRR